jgi:ligand-binding sensor domain-containing protein
LRRAGLYIILLSFSLPAFTQGLPDLHFFNLSDKDGLSNNQVRSITQDRDGIIWIGTEHGLNRFDGYGFKNFYANPADSNSFQNNRIQQLLAADNGDLWASTPAGLFRFDPATQRAIAFKPQPGDSSSFGPPTIAAFIYFDSTHLPWFTVDEGLFHFTDDLHYKKVSSDITRLAPKIPRKGIQFGGIVADRKGGLWSCWGNIVFSIDAVSKKVLRTYACPDSILIRHIDFDSHNRCWLSTWGKGVYLFDPGTAPSAPGTVPAPPGTAPAAPAAPGTVPAAPGIPPSWRPFASSPSRPVAYGSTEWTFNGQPYMVFSTNLPGLLFVNEQDLSTWTYAFDNNEVILAMPPFVDRQNVLWVPSDQGVFYMTPSRNLFNVISVPQLLTKGQKPRFSMVYNMKEEPSGYWLSKRYYGGIFWYDHNWRLLHSWVGADVPPNGRFDVPGATSGEAFDFQQRGDSMYITTESGISLLNLKTLRWSWLIPAGISPTARLRTIVVESPQCWWIRSFDHGVFLFNPVNCTFFRYYASARTGEHHLPGTVNYLLRDADHNFLASTIKGIFAYDPKSQSFEKLPLSGDPAPYRPVFGMAVDTSGLVWAGTENGLYCFDPRTNTVIRTFREDNKIGSVSRICVDQAQNIWFTANSGYWCWLRKPDKILHFEYSLGLPPTDEGIVYLTSDGSIYAGGKDALIRFYPQRLMNYHSTVRTKIIEAIVNDTTKAFETGINGRRRLTLPPDKGSFSVDFDVINYDLTGTNQYFYRLTPGNSDWKPSETGHLTFYNLQPGNYTLDVRGASKLTGHFTNTDSLDITIRSHWYRSAWLKVGSLFFLCVLAGLFFRYRLEVVRKEAAARQKMTEMEMMALRSQMNPHFIFNSLNSIENFIMLNEKRLASDYLNKFATLIRMILENSRKQLVPLSVDMEAMQLYVDLERLRFENKFDYITDIDEQLLKGDYRVTPLLIQPFVENAIVHGLAPSEKQGLWLKITVRLRDDYIHYTIEDNGVGRIEAMSYSRKHRPGHKSLGLQISRERMDIINRRTRTESTLDILDLHDADGRPAGTRVQLTINIA